MPSGIAGLRSIEFDRGAGGYVWDRSGRRYLDLVCGYGPVLLGHGHPAVADAVALQVARGSLLPGRSTIGRSFRARLLGIFDSYDGLSLFKTGSEAVAASIRLARARTGRSQILRCGFHGWHDQVVSPYVRWHVPIQEQTESVVAGVPSLLGRDITTFFGRPFDELFEVIERMSDLAAVLLDPVQLQRDPGERLRKLQRVCSARGVMLILDETKTGLRCGLRGIQGEYGISPDITIVGKALANGLPLSMMLAKGDVEGDTRSLKIKGTFADELVSIAAAMATLDVVEAEDVPANLKELGESLIERVTEALDAVDGDGLVRIEPYLWSCMPTFSFSPAVPEAFRAEFHGSMLRDGVVTLAGHMNYVCHAHTRQDANRVADAAVAASWRLRASLDAQS